MKPFNLEDALAGKPVVTRDGKSVTGFHLFEGAKSKICLGGVTSTGEILGFTREGLNGLHGDNNPGDLFMATTKTTRWVNLYATGNNTAYHFPTQEKADEFHESVSILHKRFGNKAHPIEIEE